MYYYDTDINFRTHFTSNTTWTWKHLQHTRAHVRLRRENEKSHILHLQQNHIQTERFRLYLFSFSDETWKSTINDSSCRTSSHQQRAVPTIVVYMCCWKMKINHHIHFTSTTSQKYWTLWKILVFMNCLVMEMNHHILVTSNNITWAQNYSHNTTANLFTSAKMNHYNLVTSDNIKPTKN